MTSTVQWEQFLGVHPSTRDPNFAPPVEVPALPYGSNSLVVDRESGAIITAGNFGIIQPVSAGDRINGYLVKSCTPVPKSPFSNQIMYYSVFCQG